MNTNNKKEKKLTSHFTAETLNTFPLDIELMTGNKPRKQMVDDKTIDQDGKDIDGRIFKTDK